MSETTKGLKQWHKPGLAVIGARESDQVPATIDLAEGKAVVDISDRAAQKARKPQSR